MKVNLKIKLIGEENLNLEVKGIKTNNIIKYKENELNVIITISKDKLNIKRSGRDYEINLNLELSKDTISTYSFVGGEKTFNLNTNTSILEITDDKIITKYNLEGNEFEFYLEVMK